MTDFRTLHTMLIEMHGGMLTLATACILARVITRFHQKMRRESKWYGVLRVLDNFLEKLSNYAEPTSYIASIGGFIGLIVSAIVGFYAWPAKILINSPLALKKIVFAIFTMEFWAIFILIRAKYGENLWKNNELATVYACTGFAGFFLMVLTGSLGGHMVGIHAPGKGSVLDPIYDLLGIRPETPLIVGADMVPLFVVTVSVLIGVLYLLYFRFRRSIFISVKQRTLKR